MGKNECGIKNVFYALGICMLLSGPGLADASADNDPGEVPKDYKTGQWRTGDISYPVLPDKNQLLLASEPKVTMLGDWKAKVEFTTDEETSAATVYYGMYEPDALLPWPRFAKAVKENVSGMSKQHSVELDLSKLKSVTLDIAGQMGKNDGGVIVYRLELYSPEGPARFYDRRFEFYKGKLVPTVIEGPFVNQLTETSAIISWDTDQAVNGTVKLEDAGEFSAEKKGTHFEVALSGLEPGKKYMYSVELADGKDTRSTRQYYFTTAAKDTKKFTFAVLGDSREGYGGGEYQFNGVNSRIMRTLAVDAFRNNAEFIVHTGDMINGYSDNVTDFRMQLGSYKDAIESVGHYIPIYAMMGNHEVIVDAYIAKDHEDALAYGDWLMIDKEGKESAEAVIAEEFVHPTNGPEPDKKAANAPDGKSPPPYKENVYSFDYGNSRFVVMNNNYWYNGLPEEFGGNLEGYILDDQMEWLLKEFERTKTDKSIDHLFLFAQEPLFPNGGQATTGMWYEKGDPEKNAGYDRTYVSKRRDRLWKAFVGTGKAVAANFGDEHNYSRTFITKDREGKDFEYPVWQLISGGAGAPYSAEFRTDLPWSGNVKKTTTQTNYTLFEVDGSKVMMTAYDVDGFPFDRIELTKDIR